MKPSTPLLLAALMLLPACTSVLPQGQAAPRLFVLNVPRLTQPSQPKPLPVNLQIMQPQAVPGLDSERISLRKNGQEMDFYAGARWTGTVPRIVQSQLIETFENAHTLKSVGSEQVQFNPDILLAVEIRDFQAEYATDNADTPPTVHVRLIARLIRAGKQEIMFTQSYEEKEPAAANRMQETVEAYNAAFARAASHMVQDVTQALASKQH